MCADCFAAVLKAQGHDASPFITAYNEVGDRVCFRKLAFVRQTEQCSFDF